MKSATFRSSSISNRRIQNRSNGQEHNLPSLKQAEPCIKIHSESSESFIGCSFGRLLAMAWKRKTAGGFLGFIGFMLSPLSWWNDLFVNVPVAIGFGWLVAFVYRPAFEPAVILGYWLTNVLGFVLMQKGAQRIMFD